MRTSFHIKYEVLGIAILLVTVMASTLLNQTVQALIYPFSWEYPDVSILVEDRTADYGNEITSAVSNYNHTDLSLSECGGGSNYCGNLIHLQADWGPIGWVGKAEMYSHGDACFQNPTPCNHTTDRVNFSYVYWNDYDDDPNGNNGIYKDSINAQSQARHEMGHSFGLPHHPCSTHSVVEEVGCTAYESLTDHDKSDINHLY